MTNLYIGIDPGRTGFAICYGTDDVDFQIVEGNDRASKLFYPENLIGVIHRGFAVINLDKWNPVICSEEPMIPFLANEKDKEKARKIFGRNVKIFGSQKQDVGAIGYAMKEYPFWTCTQGEWKKHWRESGRCPGMKGNMPESKYKPILDSHFGIVRSPHAWAALGIYYYNLDNYDG